MQELGTCTVSEATFPVLPDTCPVDRPLCRPNPRIRSAIAYCKGNAGGGDHLGAAQRMGFAILCRRQEERFASFLCGLQPNAQQAPHLQELTAPEHGLLP